MSALLYPLMKWVIVVGIFFGCIIVGWILQFIITKYIKRLTSKTRTKVDDILVNSIGKTVIVWFLFLGVYLSVQFLPVNIPAKVLHLINSLILGGFIVSFFWILGDALSVFVEEYIRSLSEELPTSIFKNLTKITTIVIGILMALQSVGISIAPILTALGVGGLAVALALQDTLANLFAGIHIILTRQIRRGDYIKLESGEEGFVEDINWRNTVIKTLPNNRVIVPNTKMASSILVNYDLPQNEMSVPVPVGVSYSSDLEKVERITLEVARDIQRSVEGAKRDFEPFIRFKEFGDSSINLVVILRAEDYTKQFVIRHEFIKRLKKRYDEEGIEIPFPQRDVWIRGYPRND